MPVKVMPVHEPMSTMAKAAVEDMTTKSAAVKGRTAAMEAAASAVKSATTVVAAAMTATMAAMAAMSTSDFGRQPVGSMFHRQRWIDRRERFGALAGRGRQHQHRGSRKTQTTDNAAPGIRNLHHA